MTNEEYLNQSFIDKRNQYWQSIHAMRPEYMEEFKGIHDLTVRLSIHHWAEKKYGFLMETDTDGNYTANYTVTDSKKFLLFQIKYWR